MKGDLSTNQRDGRKQSKRIKAEKEDRDGAFHLALPFDVIRSAGYRQASHTARSLLIDVCDQDPRFRNGRLVITPKALRPLGWLSEGVMRRALAELIDCGLLVQTRIGSMNSAAWFAVTWRGLDQTEGLDINPAVWSAVHRGNYRRPPKATPKPAARGVAARKNASPTLPERAQPAGIAPSQGGSDPAIAPSRRAISAENRPSPAPSQGDYLERSHLRCSALAVAPCPPARTRMGRLMADRIKRGMQPGYLAVRSRFALT